MPNGNRSNRARAQARARARKQPRNPFNGQFISWRTVVLATVIALIVLYAMVTG